MFVSGTAECQTPSQVWVSVTVSQAVGDSVARGSGTRSKLCDNDPTTDPQTWRVAVDSETGTAFQPGPVSVRRSASLTDGFSWVRGLAVTTSQEVATSVDARRR